MSSVSLKSRTVTTAVLLAIVATQTVLAQPFLCTAIRPGENAPQVAQRITGAASSTRESWFQIVDPAMSRFVPKARYDSIRAGWQACVATGMTGAVAAAVGSGTSGWPGRFRAAYADLVRLIQAPDSNLALWVVLLALIAIATHSADQYFRDREQILKAMEQFSRKFVREFEQPLVAGNPSATPIRSRLRFAPHASRLEILIAPGAGHRYPNLTDHRNNVEYDLKRVVNVLRDEPFVNGRPYMDGPWVVLPFQLKSAMTQAGGT